ncbi:CvpA family protein [Mesonia sp. K7]|uniref:CvpA family protein n=1 Tax=Mesonia sp. K7 TaxID=2218606 RepID=UPI000DAAD53C|nr:CvpA family protein [Mesonia sp. K7]PZD79026.1 hypothetical protein DNG35_03190 [Mesonia sp. K7]
MNLIDVLLGIIFVYAFVRGFMQGFISAVVSLIALAAAIYATLYHSDIITNFLINTLNFEINNLSIIGYILTFLLVFIVLVLIGRILTKLAGFLALGIVNRILGGFFNVAKYALLVSAIIMYKPAFTEKIFFKEKTIENSFLYLPVKSIAPKVFDVSLDYIEKRKEKNGEENKI